MSTPKDGDAVLAAEYVLRLLSASRQVEVEHRAATDAAFAAEIAFWQRRFSELDVEIAEVAAPASVFKALERRLFGGHATTGWLDSLMFWRGLAGVGLAVAVVAIGLHFIPLPGTTPRGETSQLVASLEQQDSLVRFIALYDANARTLRLTSLSGDALIDNDYELWAIQGDAAPASMGLLSVDAANGVALPDTVTGLDDNTVLAITIEPKGGSPTGSPTGPIVASGTPLPI